MDQNTNDVREGGVKKLLYADDLVLLGKKKVENKCKDLKALCTGERSVAQYVEKKLEETPFYASNVTIEFIEDALVYDNAYPRE